MCSLGRPDVEEIDEEIEEDVEEEEEGSSFMKRKPGRKASFSSATVDDLIHIITNSEEYKKKLIFINTKNQKNSAYYEVILKKLKERALQRGEKIDFTLSQIRNKFKKCVSECKKAALTIKTATGIKRFVDEKKYGKWFDQLFPIVKTRDSCQPEMAMEPSATKDFKEEEPQEKKQFVPVKQGKKRKAKSLEEASLEVINVVKEVIANDPTKELVALMKDEMEKQRNHEAQLFNMLLQSNQNTMCNAGYQQPPGAPTFMSNLQGYRSVPFPSTPPNPQQATMFDQGPSGYHRS